MHERHWTGGCHESFDLIVTMNILLLGGSNTGIWEGWAHHFVILAEGRLGAKVSNGFLGAVGSLYGLYQLLKMERENNHTPDIIVFEYTLNDIVLVRGSIISAKLVMDTLIEIAEFCVSRKIVLQFLCLKPQGGREFLSILTGRNVQRFYEQVAEQYGLPAPLSQRDAMARDILDSDYLDKHHLTPEASLVVAEALLRRLSGPLAIGSPTRPPRPQRAFAFLDATEASPVGRARLQQCDMTVLQAPVIEMMRPSSATWSASGRLVGVLLRCRTTSGWYSIRVDRAIRRKNASTADLALLPELVVMQYPNIRTQAREVIEIAMPDRELELMRIELDRSPMTRTPSGNFLNQEFAVFGIMLWSGLSKFDRLVETLGAVRSVLQRRRSKKRLSSVNDGGADRAPFAAPPRA